MVDNPVGALNSAFHLALSSSKHSHRPLTQDGVDPSSQNRSVKRCLIEAIHYSILSRFPSRLFPPQFLFCPSLTAPRQKTRKTTQMKATMAFVCAKLLSNTGHWESLLYLTECQSDTQNQPPYRTLLFLYSVKLESQTFFLKPFPDYSCSQSALSFANDIHLGQSPVSSLSALIGVCTNVNHCWFISLTCWWEIGGKPTNKVRRLRTWPAEMSSPFLTPGTANLKQ